MRSLDRVYHENELLLPDAKRQTTRKKPYLIATTACHPSSGEKLGHQRFMTHGEGMAFLERLDDDQRLTTTEFREIHPHWKALVIN